MWADTLKNQIELVKYLQKNPHSALEKLEFLEVAQGLDDEKRGM